MLSDNEVISRYEAALLKARQGTKPTLDDMIEAVDEIFHKESGSVRAADRIFASGYREDVARRLYVGESLLALLKLLRANQAEVGRVLRSAKGTPSP